MQGLREEKKLIVNAYERMACFQLELQMNFTVFQLLSVFSLNDT